jgi:hypothetical protein
LFVAAYLRAGAFLAERRKGRSRTTFERQATFFNALSDDAKARLESGDYPPYHLVNAARRAAGDTAETARIWLLAFLYRSAHSRQLEQFPRPATPDEPSAAPYRGTD